MPELVSNRSRRSGADFRPRARVVCASVSRAGSAPGSARAGRVRPAVVGHVITTRRSPTSIFWPTAPRRRRSTGPARGARSSFCIFIASTTSSCWPASTGSPAATDTATIRPGMIARSSLGPDDPGVGPPARRTLARARPDARDSRLDLDPPAVDHDLADHGADALPRPAEEQPCASGRLDEHGPAGPTRSSRVRPAARVRDDDQRRAVVGRVVGPVGAGSSWVTADRAQVGAVERGPPAPRRPVDLRRVGPSRPAVDRPPVRRSPSGRRTAARRRGRRPWS